MFTLSFTQSSLDDLRHLDKGAQGVILTAIDRQLKADPSKPTRNRKQLRPNALSGWELRVGDCRVFFDVDEPAAVVTIKAVGRKEHKKLFIRGKEYPL